MDAASASAALQNLTPEQRAAIMSQAQQQANQQIMSSMIESMTLSCFDKCAGTSGNRLDNKEQACLANCQDRFLDVRKSVQESLENRQSDM